MFENLPDIPPSDYGYWVSPSGEFYVVTRSEKHVGVAARLLDRPPGGEGPLNDDHRIDLWEQGWTRVAMHHRRFVIQLPPGEVEGIVIEKLHELVSHVHDQAQLPIQIEDGRTGDIAGGRTVRPGDPEVYRDWIGIAQARGVSLRDGDLSRRR